MLEKLIRMSIFLCMVNLQANDEPWKFIPVESRIRQFCQKNPYNDDVRTLLSFVYKMSKSKKNKEIVDKINKQIKALEQKNPSPRFVYPFEFTNTSEAKRAYLLMMKNFHESKCLPMEITKAKKEDRDKFEGSMNNIVQVLNVDKNKEYEYLQEGLRNAYEGCQPWNTLTPCEKFGAGIIFSVIPVMLGFFAYAMNIQQELFTDII